MASKTVTKDMVEKDKAKVLSELSQLADVVASAKEEPKGVAGIDSAPPATPEPITPVSTAKLVAIGELNAQRRKALQAELDALRAKIAEAENAVNQQVTAFKTALEVETDELLRCAVIGGWTISDAVLHRINRQRNEKGEIIPLGEPQLAATRPVASGNTEAPKTTAEKRTRAKNSYIEANDVRQYRPQLLAIGVYNADENLSNAALKDRMEKHPHFAGQTIRIVHPV